MSIRNLVQSIGGLIFLLCGIPSIIAAEPLAAFDVVPVDSAMCLEVPSVDQTWSALNANPMFGRLSAFRAFQHFLASDGIQKWERIENNVFQRTGKSLAGLFRALCAKSLIFSLQLPVDGVPRGVVITEALDQQAVQTFVDTWNQYETATLSTAKSHRGVRYFRRFKAR